MADISSHAAQLVKRLRATQTIFAAPLRASDGQKRAALRMMRRAAWGTPSAFIGPFFDDLLPEWLSRCGRVPRSEISRGCSRIGLRPSNPFINCYAAELGVLRKRTRFPRLAIKQNGVGTYAPTPSPNQAPDSMAKATDCRPASDCDTRAADPACASPHSGKHCATAFPCAI